MEELQTLVWQHESSERAAAEELEQVRAEKASLENMLREKMEHMLEKEYKDQLGGLKAEVEQWKASHQTAEEKRRATEYVLELSKLNGDDPAFHAQLADILHREKTAMQRPMTLTLERIKGELATKDAELSRRESEIRQLQEQLDHRDRKNVRGNSGSKDGNSNLETALATKTQELDELTLNYNALKSKVEAKEVPRLEEENRRLQQQCRINAMERAHLQTVLNTKIKATVDKLVDEGNGHDDNSTSQMLRSLQSVVNRSVMALQGQTRPTTTSAGATDNAAADTPVNSAAPANGNNGAMATRGSAPNASQLSFALAGGNMPSNSQRLPPSQNQHTPLPVVETIIAQRQAELREKLRQSRPDN